MFTKSNICCSEYKWKVDLVDREDDDSVEYSLKSTWYFNPKKSNGLTGEEDMVFPHLMILGIVGATMKERPAAIGVIGTHVRFMYEGVDASITLFQCRVSIALADQASYCTAASYNACWNV
jgi:hypothetical protein